MNIYYPVFYKTVDIFSKMTNRKLELSIIEGDKVYTSGDLIVIGKNSPLAKNEEDLYGLLEKELAKLLFYSENFDPSEFKQVPEKIAQKIHDIIENYRVELCWLRIYEGSREVFKRISSRVITKEEVTCPLTALLAVASGVDLPEKWKFLEIFYKKELKKLENGDINKKIEVISNIISKIESFYKTKNRENKENPQKNDKKKKKTII